MVLDSLMTILVPANLDKQIARIVPAIGLVVVVVVLQKQMKDKKTKKTDENSTPEEKRKREFARGTLASVVTALIILALKLIMKQFNVSEHAYLYYTGFVFAPVLGFLLDQIATDDGFRVMKLDANKGMQYAFRKLASASFIRYFTVCLLDIFISYPLVFYTKDLLREVTDKLKGSQSGGLLGVWDQNLGGNMPGLIQMFISIITFKAYTNQTRFNWAYDNSIARGEGRISDIVIFLSVAISSLVCLLSFTTRDKNKKELRSMILTALTAFCLLYTIQDANLSEKTWDTSHGVGALIFIVFVFIGIVLPFFQRVKVM